MMREYGTNNWKFDETLIDWKKVNSGALHTQEYRTMYLIEFYEMGANVYDPDFLRDKIAYTRAGAMAIARKFAKGNVRANIMIAYLDGYENLTYKEGRNVLTMKTIGDISRENLWEVIDYWN